MNKIKQNFEKMSPVLRKVIVAIITAIIFIAALAVTVYTARTGRSIGFILFLLLAIFGVFELCNFLDYNKYVKWSFAILVSIFIFLFPLENGVFTVIDEGWQKDSNYVPKSLQGVPNVLKYIEYALIFSFANIPGLGYLIYFLLILIFILIKPKKKPIAYLKEFLLLSFVPFAIVLCVKLIYYWAIYKFTILVILMCGIVLADTFAYFGGKFLAKGRFSKKLAPKISPNKTWVGAICGFIASFFLIFFSFYFSRIFIETFYISEQLNLSLSISLSFVVPIFSILGDLSFSLIKRKFKHKDFSSLIPEHGGLLDRFDSTIVVMILFSIIVTCAINFPY